jgi:hypothetical protein
MWTLILTLAIHVNSGASPAITSVQGFKSEKACNVAADTWKKEMKHKETELRSAVCVRLGPH